MRFSLGSALFLSFGLAACGKDDAAKSEPAKIVEPGEQPASIEARQDEVAEKMSEAPSGTAADPTAQVVDMGAVHAHLKAGKKLNAVKEYRELHGKLALNASKLGVEVEQMKLGMPSTIDVHKLYFAGKKDEALTMLAAQYNKPAEDPGIQRLWGDIDKMGEATEENLKAKAAAGASTAALAIYHQLNPETPVPEAWKAVEALMGK